ncbi:hypothetical protein [Sinorhizobium meliloti]|uniref:hypothetical protein n=1 Tax=Rhizobium meliloti TaxID=382 RepID=UPI00398CA111
MPGFIHGFIHDSKHGTSAISNHPVPLLQMKSLSRGLNQQRKGGLFVALTFEKQSVSVWMVFARAMVGAAIIFLFALLASCQTVELR